MTTILTHLDADGVCSAALIKMVPKYKNARIFFTHPIGLLSDLRNLHDDLLICDIALDIKQFYQIYEELDRISKKYQIHYFDHHFQPGLLPPNVTNIHNELISATEIVYRFFFHQLPSHAEHVVLLGAICDYLEDSPLIRELLHHYERRTLFLEAGLLAQGLKHYGHGPAYDKLRHIVILLSLGKDPCEIDDLVHSAINSTQKDKIIREDVIKNYNVKKQIAYIVDPLGSSQSKIAHWIMGHSAKVLGLAIRSLEYHPDLVDITIRGRNLLDLRQIIPDLATQCDGNAGGHANAIGCRIPKNKLDEFLQLLNDQLDALSLPPKFEIADLITFD